MTAVMIRRGVPLLEKRKPAADVLSPEEIDRLDPGMLSGMGRDALVSLRRKLSVTEGELDADCDPGTPEWEEWEQRMGKLPELMDRIDEMLDPEEDDPGEDDRS